MNQKNSGIVLSIVATLLSVVVSEAMPNLILKIIFIIFFSLEAILYLNFLDSKEKKKKIMLYILGGVIIVMLILPCITTGSLNSYIIPIQNFFNFNQNQEKNEISDNITNLTTEIKNEISDSTADIANQISAMDNKISELYNSFSEYTFFKDKENQQQIDEILTQISSDNEISKFSDLSENKHSVELFYKMRLSSKLYYYCNIIKALEAYGINCKYFSIDEYTLLMWDIERLYAIYNMRKSLESDLQNNTFYEKKLLYYNDFKINMSEYKYNDIFNYESWHKLFENKTTSQIMEVLNEDIMSFYKKFNINFKEI